MDTKSSILYAPGQMPSSEFFKAAFGVPLSKENPYLKLRQSHGRYALTVKSSTQHPDEKNRKQAALIQAVIERMRSSEPVDAAILNPDVFHQHLNEISPRPPCEVIAALFAVTQTENQEKITPEMFAERLQHHMEENLTSKETAPPHVRPARPRAKKTLMRTRRTLSSDPRAEEQAPITYASSRAPLHPCHRNLSFQIASSLASYSVFHEATNKRLEKNYIPHVIPGVISEEHVFSDRIIIFNDLLEMLLGGYIEDHAEHQILKKWNISVQEQKKEKIHSDSFVKACAYFLDHLDQKKSHERKLHQLLSVLDQSIILDPFNEIVSYLGINQMLFKIIYDRPNRLGEFKFLIDGHVEFHSLVVMELKEHEHTHLKLPHFEIEMHRVLRAPLERLDVWDSQLKILIICKEAHNPEFKKQIIAPLSQYKLDITVESKGNKQHK